MVGHLQQDPILGTISSTALVGYLQQYGPVGCQLSIPDLGGHAVVVTNAQSVPSGETYVWVADPMDGQIVPMPYAQLCSNFRGHGGQWIRTYITS